MLTTFKKKKGVFNKFNAKSICFLIFSELVGVIFRISLFSIKNIAQNSQTKRVYVDLALARLLQVTQLQQLELLTVFFFFPSIHFLIIFRLEKNLAPQCLQIHDLVLFVFKILKEMLHNLKNNKYL